MAEDENKQEKIKSIEKVTLQCGNELLTVMSLRSKNHEKL